MGVSVQGPDQLQLSCDSLWISGIENAALLLDGSNSNIMLSVFLTFSEANDITHIKPQIQYYQLYELVVAIFF